MNVPAPVFNRLLQVTPPNNGTGRAYLSNEHRPYVLYGINAVSYLASRQVGLRTAPNGVGPVNPPVGGFFTLVEWGTMVPRFSRIPVMAADPGSVFQIGGGVAIPYPLFPCVPFVVDLAASYVEVPPFLAKNNVVLFDVAIVPADAVNVAAAGLKFPRK